MPQQSNSGPNLEKEGDLDPVFPAQQEGAGVRPWVLGPSTRMLHVWGSAGSWRSGHTSLGLGPSLPRDNEVQLKTRLPK